VIFTPEGEEQTMANVKAIVKALLNDEQGGEVLEYALIAGLIIVGAIALITSVGTKVVARWTSLDGSL
jgi:Flp pilus assembly pilin Flp